MARGSNWAWYLFLSMQLYSNTATQFMYVLSITAFMLQQQRWLVVTETLWPKSPQMYSHYVFGKILLTCVLGCWDHFETTLDYFMEVSFHYLFSWANYKFISKSFTKIFGTWAGEIPGHKHKKVPSVDCDYHSLDTRIWSMNTLPEAIAQFSFVIYVM